MKLISLTQGKFAKVDDEMFDTINQWKWFAYQDKNTFYAARTEYLGGGRKNLKNKRIIMHRFIMGITNPNVLIDHADRDGLNNQKINLREATNSQNCKNKKAWGSSSYLGVSLHVHKHTLVNGTKKEYRKWRAIVHVNGKSLKLGLYAEEWEAALAYDTAAKIHHGEFANLNFKK